MLRIDAAAIISAARNSPAFRLAARFWTARTRFDMGNDSYLLEVSNGDVVRFDPVDSAIDAEIVVGGPAESWAKLLQAVPPPGFHDPLYNDGRSGFTIKGDFIGTVAPHLHAVQEFVNVMRRSINRLKPGAPLAAAERDFDVAVGRYMYVHVLGVQYRIYFEEAGEGATPLLVMHTAGSDSRQWRHFLEDPDYRKLYRIISFDLPFHGKSLPPMAEGWWEKPYVLTRDFLMETVVAISRKLGLDRPVFMGAAIGGMLAADLALYRPDDFRAVVAINGGLAVQFDDSQAEKIHALSSPKVGNQWKAALMLGNVAPTSQEAHRREFAWVYSQGAPAVLEGALFYYGKDHDLTCEQASTIDTSKVAVYLLTGEYDFLATEFGTARLAKAIPGCHFQIMPGLGHFGPTENPEAFKRFLLPVLQDIAAQGSSPRDRRGSKREPLQPIT